MFVLVYDEHGGLFDHVVPGPAEDDSPAFLQYGVRVPAFIVSPWVAQGAVASIVFDHTSLLQTILLRFCRDSSGAIPNMGKRVTAAHHLGALLTETAPRPPADLTPLIATAAKWKAMEFHAAFEETAELRALPGTPNELQSGLAKAKKRLIAQGHPEGHP